MPTVLDAQIARLGPIGPRARPIGRSMPGADPLPRYSSATPTTVQIGRGSRSGTTDPDRRERLLGLIAQTAMKNGLGVEGAKALQAVAITEGGLEGAVGDVEGGGSFGPFQFYAKGQLPAFAAALGVPVDEAKRVAVTNPEVAVEWAVRGYLGNAVRRGLGKGLRGAALATYAQEVGQVSESPERAGQNYAATFASGSMPIGLDRADTSGYKTGTAQGDPDLVPNQFGDPTLTAAEAWSACGPAAAVAFARKWGRNPTMREAVDLARTVGWDEAGGMNGFANQVRLVQALAKQQGIEIPIKAEAGSPNWDAVTHDALLGNPVTISTDVHYYVVDGYDPETGKFHVGQSGLNRKSISSAWATADQIAADGINGTLYVDHPLVPGRSWAGRGGAGVDTGGRDDYRLSSMPGANTYDPGTYRQDGYNPSDWTTWNTVDPETGHERGLDPSAYPVKTGLSSFDPTETYGWKVAKTINDDFTYNLPERQRSFLEEHARPLDLSSMRAPGVGGYEEVPAESPFAPLLDPSAGVPYLSSVAAPPTRRRSF